MTPSIRLGRGIVSLGLALLALVFFIPLVWMVLSSFKSNAEIFTTPFSLPTGFDFTIWAQAWEVGNLGQAH